MYKSIVILQSGGPTCVINTSLLAIIDAAKEFGVENIYGSLFGVEGLINDNIIDLLKEEKDQLDLLKQTPGAILGSSRYFLNKDFDNDYQKILHTVQKHNIHQIFIIGGNDSMDTVLKLDKFFKSLSLNIHVIGVPKTIDNDLVNIDLCPGYLSAVKYIANTLACIKQDASSYQKGRVTIVEVMGRDSGFLTAGSKLANYDLICLPEVVLDIDDFIFNVNRIYNEKGNVFVAVSEGIKDKNGEYILNSNKYISDNDVFGHKQLGGVAKVLTNIIHEKLNFPVRSIELNLQQRCSSFLSSQNDINYAYELGRLAFINSIDCSGIMMTRINNIYQTIDVSLVANKIKYFPLELIDNYTVSDKFVNYLKDFLDNNNELTFSNGIIEFSQFKKIKV